jgi:cytochrome P450
MNRFVKEDVALSDGTTLPAGSRIMVSKDLVNDPSTFKDPSSFDASRFMHMREQPGEVNRHQYVTTSPEMMGFGHGEHACPGRFFASNEMKIALCVLLTKYDLRFIPGVEPPKPFKFEAQNITHPKLKIEVKRREEEIDLLSPKA